MAPGFVDIHTHYDGQVSWDGLLEPSSGHGVTTVVTGNCGVGFAPVRPGTEDWLIALMEGVEDIPGTALTEGITWGWETYPEYLDAIGKQKYAIDVGSQVAHGAIRAYAMGERGARNEPATPEDIAAMGRLVTEAIEAGALGFSTSRTMGHRAMDGEPVPGTFAAEEELFGLGRAMAAGGQAVFELAPQGAAGEDIIGPKKELDWMRRLSGEIDRPVSFALIQVDADPNLWREQLDLSAAAHAAGARLYPQIAARPFGMMIGFQGHHGFSHRPTYRRLKAECGREELAQRLADPAVKAAILAEDDLPVDPTLLFDGMFALVQHSLHRLYALGNPPDYEPTPDRTVAAIAKDARRGPAVDAVRPDARAGRDRHADAAAVQLRRRQPRCDPGDDAAPRRRAGAVRRRRALRNDLRRFLSHVPAHALGTGPAPRREAVAGVRDPQAVPRHRRTCSVSPTAAPSSPARRPTST